MTDKTGGAAFPVAYNRETQYAKFGMTLRDYFAAKAMQGILANPAQLDNVNYKSAEWVSRDAYLVADAMLKARG
ncbi:MULTISPECIES: hypothetical protein [Providencia]|uniref:hypothetical protein n=1 Tax=Providencia TaxID=586 RepID=UPI0008FB33BD|nr:MULTISPECIES: hypothetical protein [unclassified Providencia]APC12917.1 hypothetical protein RB151_032590 [Providencia rettgeri]ELR5055068.1 hypothetical protein [Providencia rettgeri]ELR5157451.1 hypothetical protein [Providencia rettgeri]ELR5184431.1 hypothetical protein [Providencia rettgeri]ELR5266842.1 hypothetical protein [Providencia rettgeri]